MSNTPMGHPLNAAFFSFGSFTLDIEKRELRGVDGPIKLVGKPFDVLVYLIKHHARVVPGEEVFHAVWNPDGSAERVFDPEYIQHAILVVRKALGDDAKSPRYILTDRGRGVRFIASLETEPSEDLPFTDPPKSTAPKRPSRLIFYALIVFLALLATAIATHSWRNSPVVVQMEAMTHSGFRKFAPIIEDGGHFYFTELAFGRYRIVRVNGSSKESSVLKTNVPDPYLCDLNRRDHSFLIRSVHGGFDDYGPLYIQHQKNEQGELLPIIAFDGVWSPDAASVIFARDGDVSRFDLSTRKTSILAHVDGFAWWPRVAPSGDRIRFTVTDAKGQLTTIWEVHTNGTGLHRLFDSRDPWANAGCGNWSADGGHFVFQVGPLSASTLWIRDERFASFARKPLQLTSGPSYRGPAPTSDGLRILARTQTYQGELTKVQPKTGVETTFMPQVSADIVSLSPNGTSITYVISPEGSLWLSNTDSGGARVLIPPPLESAFPQWSPAGDRIAVATRRRGAPWKISIVEPDSGRLDTFELTDGNAIHPTWAPDGKQILFGTIPTIQKSSYIYKFDVTSRQVTPIPGSQGLFTPAWSPTGRYIVALRAETYDLVVLDHYTGQWSTLARSRFGYPVWSKDEKWIYTFRKEDGGVRFFRIGLADHKTEEVIYLPGLRMLDRWIGLHPDGSLLLAKDVGGQEVYSLALARPLH
jgi:Tol biopolymer transport system component/DNA-binding winged helix-turn-helix (wHTH) protein